MDKFWTNNRVAGGIRLTLLFLMCRNNGLTSNKLILILHCLNINVLSTLEYFSWDLGSSCTMSVSDGFPSQRANNAEVCIYHNTMMFLEYTTALRISKLFMNNRLKYLHIHNTEWRPGPRFNIKMTSYQYRKSHCGDKTILRQSYLHNGISYTGKMTSLYWIRAQASFISCILIIAHQQGRCLSAS